MSKPSKPSLVLRLWRSSQTKIWASTQAIGAAGLGLVDYLVNVTSSEQFKNVLSTITVPWYIPTGIAVFALVSYLAHGHDA